MKVLEAQATTCYHCGESCKEGEVRFEDKTFCCSGCKSVYTLLSDCKLSTYYELEQQPGISLQADITDSYEWLEEAAIANDLIDFQDAYQTQVRLSLPQIHCSSCIWLLEHFDRLQPAVTLSRVDFPNKSLELVYDHHQVDLKTLVGTLAQIGYPPAFHLQSAEGAERPSTPKRLIKQLGIAGFCFGNMMLLSFPEYLGLQQFSYSLLFSSLNLFLGLIVLRYAAIDYFRSAYYGLLGGHANMDVPISLGILALLGNSIYQIVFLGEAGYMDSLAGLVFFLLIGKWFQQMSLDKISFDRTYESFFPLASCRITDSGSEYVPIQELEIGDHVEIRNKELIPTDSLLLSSQASLDYSFVSGESRPVELEKGAKLYAGGRVLGESIEVQVKKQVSNSYLTQLWARKEPPVDSSIKRISELIGKYFTLAVLAIASLGLWFWWEVDTGKALQVFTSVLIIACPCAIALNIPFTLGNARRILWKKGFITRSADTLFALAKIDHIVFDKTGTLTERNHIPIIWKGKDLGSQEWAQVKSLVLQSQHPLSKSIAFNLKEFPEQAVEQFEEIAGKGIRGKVAEKVVQIGSYAYLEGQNEEVKEGTWLKMGGVIKGKWIHRNRPRPGVEMLLKSLGKRFTLSLLSGDTHAREGQWKELLGNAGARVRFHQSPFDKLDRIQHFQEAGDKVLMVGDGLNDAGALQQSDVGIAISEDSSYFAPACDGIILGKQLVGLEGYLRYSRMATKLVSYGFLIALLYNLIGLSFALKGTLTPVVTAILMPLSSLTLIGFALLSTYLLAFVMLKDDKSH